MRKATILTAVFAALATWCPRAHAQTFGEQGLVTLSLERVFGLHWMHTSIDRPAPDGDYRRDVTVFGLGWYRSETAYHNPRAGVDFFVIDRVSLGGSLGLYAWGSDGDRQGILFEPRIGYAVSITPAVAFWPRGGFTFFSEEDSGGPTYTQFALSGEGMFAFLPRESWAILVGPTLDLGITGEVRDTRFIQHALGIAVGLMGAF
jgi:hypothetical protein